MTRPQSGPPATMAVPGTHTAMPLCNACVVRGAKLDRDGLCERCGPPLRGWRWFFEHIAEALAACNHCATAEVAAVCADHTAPVFVADPVIVVPPPSLGVAAGQVRKKRSTGTLLRVGEATAIADIPSHRVRFEYGSGTCSDNWIAASSELVASSLEEMLRATFADQAHLHLAVYGGAQVIAYLSYDQRQAIADSEKMGLEEMVATIRAALAQPAQQAEKAPTSIFEFAMQGGKLERPKGDAPSAPHKSDAHKASYCPHGFVACESCAQDHIDYVNTRLAETRAELAAAIADRDDYKAGAAAEAHRVNELTDALRVKTDALDAAQDMLCDAVIERDAWKQSADSANATIDRVHAFVTRHQKSAVGT